MDSDRPRVGFIGIGLMGQPMALRLLDAGYSLHVWNRSADKLKRVAQAGATAHLSPDSVTRNADIICLCLTDGAAVEQVILGEQGIINAGAPGKVVVDFSSIEPKRARMISGRLWKDCEVTYVDAPVSGGVRGAEGGQLIIMCGGEAAAIEKLKPLFAHLARKVTHMGGVGAGQITKLCNQLIVSATILATAEAVVLGRRNGINVTTLPDALRDGWADSSAFQFFGQRMATERWEPIAGTVDTMLKDVFNIVQLADGAGLPSPLARAASEIYRSLSMDGRGPNDLGSICSFFDLQMNR